MTRAGRRRQRPRPPRSGHGVDQAASPKEGPARLHAGVRATFLDLDGTHNLEAIDVAMVVVRQWA
jgi:hypothetical protein